MKLAALSFALVLASGAPAGAADAAAVAAIDRECAASVDAVIGGDPTGYGRIFSGDDNGSWRVADDAMLHRIAIDPNIYSEVAKVWTLGGRVVLVNVEQRSLDISAYSTYCFRPGGTLARVNESTSGLRVRDDESRYFDLRGKLVGSQSHFYNIYANLGNAVSPDLRPSTPSLYLTVEALPFYHLMVSP